MHDAYARSQREIDRHAEAVAEPYYHVEYCFVRGVDGPTLRCDIEPTHIDVFLDEMLRKGGVKILTVSLVQA